jgi:hypothetical protein
MYLKMVDEFEGELKSKGTKISPELHDARFEFALWLEKKAAQQSVQPTCSSCGGVGGHRYNCKKMFPTMTGG